MLDTSLKELGFNHNTRIIYMRLLESGPSTASKLAGDLGIPRSTIYDKIKILITNGLVVELMEENKKTFLAEDVKNISLLLKNRIELLKKQEKAVKRILPELLYQGQPVEPKIKFYNGVEGIKQVLSDLLWYEEIETYTMWPISEMVEVLGKEYLENLNRRRIRHKISITGIWPRNKKVDFVNHPYLGVGKGHLRNLRLAPENMTWDMSYWLYDDKVAFISSKKEMFGFVIHSRDFAQLIKSQFEQIWKISTPIKAQPKYTDEFLRSI